MINPKKNPIPQIRRDFRIVWDHGILGPSETKFRDEAVASNPKTLRARNHLSLT